MRILDYLAWIFIPLTVGLSGFFTYVYQVSPLTAAMVSFTLSTLINLFFFRVIKVEGHQRLIIVRGGQYRDPGVQGGRAFLLRGLDTPLVVDMRPRPEEIKGARCYTREGASLTVNGLFLWRVLAPVRMYRDAPSDLTKTIAAKAVSALQSTINTMSLDAVLQERGQLNQALANALHIPEKWGVQVHSVEIRDIRLDPDVEAARNRQAAAARDREAAAIEAQAAAEVFRAFAKVLGQEAALELYKLGVLSKGTWVWSPLEILEKGRPKVVQEKAESGTNGAPGEKASSRGTKGFVGSVSERPERRTTD